MKQTIMIIGLLMVSACGFKPIYATPEGASSPVNRQIAIGPVSAPEEVHLYIADALRERIVLPEGEAPKYELTVTANDAAQQLAVQIDATVTRYNYRLRGRYTLRDLKTQQVRQGRARAITSYNIVSSQYSTLHAERTAREKAARLLAEAIERDILLKLAEEADAESIDDAIDPDFDDPVIIEEVGEPRDSFESGDQPFLIDEGINDPANDPSSSAGER